MTRRALLASLAATFVLDPERLLWKPGAKLISVPAHARIAVDADPYAFPFPQGLGCFVRGSFVPAPTQVFWLSEMGLVELWPLPRVYSKTITSA